MQAWRQHWNHQLYKALEHQYQMGLEALNKNLPEIQIDLTFKSVCILSVVQLSVSLIVSLLSLHRSLPCNCLCVHIIFSFPLKSLIFPLSWIACIPAASRATERLVHVCRSEAQVFPHPNLSSPQKVSEV